MPFRLHKPCVDRQKRVRLAERLFAEQQSIVLPRTVEKSRPWKPQQTRFSRRCQTKSRRLLIRAAAEGLNNKVKLVTGRSYGFRGTHVAKLALYHNLGRLPEPNLTHRFC